MLWQGRARRVRFSSLADFAEALTRCPPNEAFGLGQLIDGLEDEVEIVTIEKLNGGGSASRISRSAEFFHYRPGPGVIAIDSDTKGQPDDVRARVEAAGGVWDALVKAMPELEGVGRVLRASTTAGLRAAGKPITGGSGEHIYVLVEDIADTKRFLTAAHGRCWLAGFGWYLISASGKLLERSIVDTSTGQPERLFYEGAPELGRGLTQDAAARRARVVEGRVLDTAAVVLTEAEKAELAKLQAAEKARYSEQANAVREARVAEHIQRGGSEKTFRLAAEHHQLVPDFPLHFNNPALGMATVAEVLADVEKYANKYLADPLEGVDYGRTKAIVLKWGDGTPYIRSFAHGLTTLYRLTTKADGGEADIGQVEAALAALPADTDWYRAALATHAATSGSEAGWALLNRVHPTAREAWDALQPMAVTAGTLFFLADEAQPGWREEYDARLEEQIEEANRAATGGATDTAEPRPRTEDAGPRSLASKSDPDAEPASAKTKGQDEAEQADDSGARSLLTPLKWRECKKGNKPTASLHNARVAIARLGIECRYDLFHEKILVGYRGGEVWHAIPQLVGELSDIAETRLRQMVSERFGFDPTGAHIHDAIKTLATDHCFDPVLDLLDEAQAAWDGKPRLDAWVVTYLGCEDTKLNRAIGRKVLIAGVRRARDPGSKFDNITVLEGDEGLLKSTVIRILAGDENFSDQSLLGAHDKEVQELLAGVWFHESADLAGMRRADVEHVKAFASRQVDRARPAYGRNTEWRKRRSIEWGTTNNSEYLQSQTGNRRFWPLRVGSVIRIEELTRDRLQLLGEAAVGERCGPTPLKRRRRGASSTRGRTSWLTSLTSFPSGPTVTTASGVRWRRISFTTSATARRGWRAKTCLSTC